MICLNRCSLIKVFQLLSFSIIPYIPAYPGLLVISQKIGELRKMSDKVRADAEIDALTRQVGEKLKELPVENYNTLQLIIQHLRRVADNVEYNKMGPANLGTVFGPTLMRAGEDKVL